MKKTIYLLSFLFFTGCLSNSDDIDPLFGYRYNIVETDEYPVILNDSLIVKVQYGGCNDNHDFTILHKKESHNYSEVWLFKQTPDQSCEAVIQEIRSFRLPVEVFSTNQAFVIGPDNSRTLVRQ